MQAGEVLLASLSSACGRAGEFVSRVLACGDSAATVVLGLAGPGELHELAAVSAADERAVLQRHAAEPPRHADLPGSLDP